MKKKTTTTVASKKLPESFKKMWLEALRSGEYKQTDGTLCKKIGDRYEYCVLGVAAKIGSCQDIIDKGFITSKQGVKHTDNFPKILTGETKLTEGLAEMNDEGRTFEELADYIEKTL